MRKRSSECHSWKNLILQFVVFTSTNDTGTQHPRKNCFVITKKRTHSMFLPLKTNKDGVIRGYLPREISRVTKFLLDRGARMTAILTSVNYRRSPLVQGGLEIPCRVKITMANTKKCDQILDRYLDLISTLYTEPYTLRWFLDQYLATIWLWRNIQNQRRRRRGLKLASQKKLVGQWTYGNFFWRKRQIHPKRRNGRKMMSSF